jgi:hypothetical protein
VKEAQHDAHSQDLLAPRPILTPSVVTLDVGGTTGSPRREEEDEPRGELRLATPLSSSTIPPTSNTWLPSKKTARTKVPNDSSSP